MRALARLLFLSPLLTAIAHGDLLALWKLESNTADEVDSFPTTWDGTGSYTQSVVAPTSAAAGVFSGTNWLKCGTGINFERNQSFSASAWIKGSPQDSSILGDMTQGEGFQGWELHVGTEENGGVADSVTVWLINDYPAIAIQVNATAPVLDDQWHHVAFTYDGSSTAAGVAIYIDGAPATTHVGRDTLGSSIANNTEAELNIGTRMNGAHHTFSGAIDEIAVFDSALGAAEMTSIFQSGIESISPPKVSSTVPIIGQSIATLTTAEVAFSFPVNGVDAADLLVNNSPAAEVEMLNPKLYRFTFASPPQGDVYFSWAADSAISGTNGVAAQLSEWSARLVPTLPPEQVMIAEFLTKNAGGYEDEDHDTPDWIELVNPGTADVNLDGWTLTDDATKTDLWKFPAMVLAPGARLVVFASGKNRINPAGRLHTNFKLSSDGGYLALANPAGSLVQVFDGYPQQEGNVSFGFLDSGHPSDGRAGWRYLSPTPTNSLSENGYVYSGADIFDMKFTPAAPVPGDAITVTIRTAPNAVQGTAPSLSYQVMFGRGYRVNFSDDGQHGDGEAGDGLWGAIIPAGASVGQMVRWRASLTSNSVVSRWPISGNPGSPLPTFEGTVIGGNTASQALPAYQVFVQDYAFPVNTNQTGIDSSSGGRGAFFGNGKLYDNVLIRIKGTTSRDLFKRSHRVDFNPGRDFEWSPDLPAQRELNLNSEYVDPSYLRQNQQLWMHRNSGNSGAPHFPVRLLMNGENWQLAFHTYPADSELVETMGLDPRGAIYKQVGQLNNTSGEKKSRNWESNSDLATLVSGISEYNSNNSRSRYIHDNLNLPAVINYLAVTRLAQEADDVWANMVVYRDSEGSGEWQPIPFDLNLSFGQLFYGFSSPYNTTIQATNDANKSHPLYGSGSCLPNTGNFGQYNRLYNAIITNSETREMLLRRIRSLTDRYLSTNAATSPLESNFDTLGALIGPDAVIDRARWGLPPNAGPYGLGPGISPSQGLATLKSSFLVPRRTHFYITHSINNLNRTLGIGNNNKAGIPDAQIAAPVIGFGTIEAHPASENQDQEFIELTNPGNDAVDVSDWTVRGATGSFKLRGGTVIVAGGSLYISPNVVAFRARSTSPKANENRFVVGPYSGHLSAYGETLSLENTAGELVAQTQVPVDPSAPPLQLAVTEIMANSAHTDSDINGDWWELTNTGSSTVNLSGLSWDDSRGLAGQAIFPAITLSAGASAIILDESDASRAAAFRTAWNLPASVQILTREDFRIDAFRGIGNGDAIILYLPDGTQIARIDFPSYTTGKSRAWFRDGVSIPDGNSEPLKYGTVTSSQNPADNGSPGFAATNPTSLTLPYDIWAAANDLWFTDASPDADTDGDGRDNRTEYIFGGAPRLADTPPAASLQPVGGEQEWSYVRRSDDPSLAFGYESSTDLADWKPITLTEIFQVPDSQLPGFVRVTCRLPSDLPTIFFRVRGN